MTHLITDETKFSLEPASSAASEKLFFEPGEYFHSLLVQIDRAQSEIILETYIFKLDAVGRQFITGLRGAAQRGVKIKILVDGVGSYDDSDQIARLLESQNCELLIFHPLPWDFPAYRRALVAGRWYSQILYLIAEINHRNHRKLCIVDNRMAWLGSFNITADHFNKSLVSADDNWHDTGLSVTGDVVLDLKTSFEEVWSHKTSPLRKRTRHFMGINSVRSRISRNRRLLRILNRAHERIWITNAYFNPSIKLLAALRRAAIRGVDVRLLVPSRSDVFFFPSITRTYYIDLLNAGIRVFEYGHRLLHSKTMLIDDVVLIGSTNLNYRSFFHDLELDALLTSRKSINSMHKRYIFDTAQSSEITLRRWSKYPLLSRLLGWCSKFIRYWL